MKKNLIFVNVDALDKARGKFVDPITSKLDEGTLFKSFVILMLNIAAFGALIGGVLMTVTGLIGDRSFISQHITSEYVDGAHQAGAVGGLILGAVLSLFVAWFLFALISKRTEQLKNESYDNLLSYLFVKVFPRMIIIAGEVTCTLLVYVSILGLIATCVGSAAYGPLGGYGDMMVGMLPGMDLIPSTRVNLVGNYDYFEAGIKSGILGLVGSIITLIGFYIYREVYNYMLKLAVILIAYMPKFAIPLAIRKRSEN